MTPEDYRSALAGGLAGGMPTATLWRHARAFIRDGLIPLAWCEEVLGPEGVRPAVTPRSAPEPPKPTPPDCIHLGPALPLQPGCGCAEKRRECSEFGEASLKPSKAEHHCLNADGSVACPAYEPKD